MADGVIYLRVSTGRQELGASLDTQRALIADYAQKHGITVIREFCDIMSGTRDDRPQYRAMLDMLRPGMVVLLFRLDRIGRKKSELFRFFEWCKERRIGIVPVTQPEMANELARDIMSVLAAHESQQISERVKANMHYLVEQRGQWVSKPPRYYAIGPDKRLIPAENAGEAVRVWEMFVATGGDVTATALAFGIERAGLRWMFRNRAYVGDTVWGSERTGVVVVPDTHPAIVPRPLWEQAREIVTRRKHRGVRVHNDPALLTGFLYVAASKHRLYHMRHKGGQRYYRTTSTAPVRHMVLADEADAAALAALKTLSLTPAQRRAIERDLHRRVRRDPAKAERAALQQKISALEAEQVMAARMAARGEMTPHLWERTRQEQAAELAALMSRLALLPPIPDPAKISPALAVRVNLASAIDAAHRAGQIAALRLLIEGYIERFEVWGAETPRLRGAAAHHWRAEHPPRYVPRWTDAVME